MPPKAKLRSTPQSKLTLAELLETEIVRCGHCKKLYDQPLLLPCLHTLCTQCVVDTIVSTANSEVREDQHQQECTDHQRTESTSSACQALACSAEVTKVTQCMEANNANQEEATLKLLPYIYFDCPLCRSRAKLTKHFDIRKSDVCHPFEDSNNEFKFSRFNNDINFKGQQMVSFSDDMQHQVRALVELSLARNYFLQSLTQLHARKRMESRECLYCRYEGKSVPASSYCMDCKDDMCKDCCSAHQKTKLTRNHQVAWDEGVHRGLFDYDIRSRSFVPCGKHPPQPADQFCSQCQLAMCELCGNSEHQDHKVEGVEPTSKRLLSEIQHIQRAFSRTASSLAAHSRLLKQHQDKLLTCKETIMTQIATQTEQLHDMINRERDRLVHQLEEDFGKEKTAMDKKLWDVQCLESSLIDASQLLLHVSTCGRPDEIVSLHEHALSRYTQLVNSTPTYRLTKKLAPVYRPGPCTERNVSILLGQVSTQRIAINKEAKYRTPPPVSTLMPAVLQPPQLCHSFNASSPLDTKPVYPTGLAFHKNVLAVVDRANASVKLFDPSSKLLNELGHGEGQAKIQKPFDATFFLDGTIAVTDTEGGSVKMFDRSGQFLKSFTGNLKHPKGIALTHSKGEITVIDGLLRNLTVFNAKSGEMVKELQPKICDHEDDQSSEGDILIEPTYVAVSPANNYVITDMAAPHIKVLTSQADLLTSSMTYGTRQQELLHPGGLCVDKFGQIFIADTNNSRVHVGLPSGEMTELLVTAKDGISKPTCLTITDEGHLCIGQSGGDIKIFKYL
ncbi:tripartite motif-containing protein 2 [Biomphalaria glabrata]|uniref:B box-type domain-containing protein n=1 Tax=Biomphalaria glabrata TaxID=6526 RepID=A0A2C9KPF7_BIOGL|nr:tripartite motif-containing protein 2 [Biomphalaria glabrata]